MISRDCHLRRAAREFIERVFSSSTPTVTTRRSRFSSSRSRDSGDVWHEAERDVVVPQRPSRRRRDDLVSRRPSASISCRVDPLGRRAHDSLSISCSSIPLDGRGHGSSLITCSTSCRVDRLGRRDGDRGRAVSTVNGPFADHLSGFRTNGTQAHFSGLDRRFWAPFDQDRIFRAAEGFMLLPASGAPVERA